MPKPNNFKAKTVAKEAIQFGKEEVVAEEKGDMRKAVSFGKAEKAMENKAQRTRFDPSRRSSPSNRGQQRVTAERGKMWDFQITYNSRPTPRVFPLVDGSSITSDVYRDRVETGKPQVVISAGAGVNFSSQVGIQTPNGVIEPLMENTVGTWIVQLYSALVRNYQFKQGRLIRDTVLDNPGVVGVSSVNGSFAFWINTYSDAYLCLRGLEGWLSAGTFNEATNAISTNISQVTPRLKDDLRRLMEYKVPSAWNTILDSMCGPVALDENSPAFGLQLGLTTTVFDMSDIATVTAILVRAENDLKLLAFPNNVALNNDFARIANITTLLYGSQPLPGPKTMSSDSVMLWMIYTQVCVLVNTTVNQQNAWPNLNATGVGTQMIPILDPRIPGGSTAQLFTALRPGAVSNNATTGVGLADISNQVGLISTQLDSNHGSVLIITDQNLNTTLVQVQEPTPNQIASNSNTNNLFWVVQNTAEGTDYTHLDIPQFEHRVVYMRYDQFVDMTVRSLEEIWMGASS